MTHHAGLFFTDKHRQQAKQQRARAPLDAAWSALASLPESDLHTGVKGGLADAIRWSFAEDRAGGERAIALVDAILRTSPVKPSADWLADRRQTVALAQMVALLRGHPAAATHHERWGEALTAHVTAQQPAQPEGDTDAGETVVLRLWTGLAKLAVGVVTANQDGIDAGSAVFRAVIDDDVHPEGYIAEAVETRAADGLRNQVLCAQALVLLAEAGTHAGRDLWSYEKRGVSARTAATYPLYYFFYPEQWPWGDKTWKRGEGLQQETLDLDTAQAIFREHAGWLEILNAHYGPRPLKAVRLLLDELRPIYDAYGGGLTTLSHGFVERRRGLFG